MTKRNPSVGGPPVSAARDFALAALVGLVTSGSWGCGSAAGIGPHGGGGADGGGLDAAIEGAFEAAAEAPRDSSPEAGADGGASAEAGADAGLETGVETRADAASIDASCNNGCAPSETGAFCQPGEVQWACSGASFDAPAFGAACRDPGTNLQRYCCPPTFLGACQTAATNTCIFEASYTFHDDGGLRAFVDTSTLTPPRSHTISRAGGRAGTAGACARDVPCTAATAVTVSAIKAALADPDVQAALAKPKGLLYGGDPRPVDGTVWVFERNDGHDFTVGSGAVPAGLRALDTLLHQLATETLAAPECAALAAP